MSNSSFEITIPVGTPLTGSLSAKVVDYQGVTPGNIIRADHDWAVHFDWSLKGPLAGCLCGEFCLRVFMESIGPGPELALPFKDDIRVPLDPCGDGHYKHIFRIPAGSIPAEACGPAYRVVGSLSFYNTCDEPGPISGFCDLGMVQFYRSEAHK